MKPKDLKIEGSFDKRIPLLIEGMFYLPEHYTGHKEHPLPVWSDPRIFGNDLPVALEFCAGNGHWIQERAQATREEKNWVAIERRFDRVRKIWSKKTNHKITNLFIVCGEGHTFATEYVASHSVAEIYINFPDPWPKRRHAKHRIMKDSFLEEMARILVSEGKVTFVTDDKPYLEATMAVFDANKNYIQEGLIINPPNYGVSYFDNLWREKGRTIYHVYYSRRKPISY
jgi:tRNA (guanine-N7-)-methyltransferase